MDMYIDSGSPSEIEREPAEEDEEEEEEDEEEKR